jgi:hypothetical protein
MKPGLAAFAIVAALAAACQSAPPPAPPLAGSGDAAFTTLASLILKARYRRHPSSATDLGIHTFDSMLDDASQASIAE